MTHIPARSISHRADLTTDPHLPEQWWTDLRAALDALAGHTTDRLCMPQTHLTARISEVYGDAVDTTVTDWACAHGDLGWANLCGPDLAVFAWEDWGNAPVGLDTACLWAASLPQPAVADRVLDLFADVFITRSGRLVRLLLCANTARAHKRTGTPGPLTDAMARTADDSCPNSPERAARPAPRQEAARREAGRKAGPEALSRAVRLGTGSAVGSRNPRPPTPPHDCSRVSLVGWGSGAA